MTLRHAPGICQPFLKIFATFLDFVTATLYVSDRAGQNKVFSCLLWCIAVWAFWVLVYSPLMECLIKSWSALLLDGWALPLMSSDSVESWQRYFGSPMMFSPVGGLLFQPCRTNVKLFFSAVERLPWLSFVAVGACVTVFMRGTFSSVLAMHWSMVNVAAFHLGCGGVALIARSYWVGIAFIDPEMMHIVVESWMSALLVWTLCSQTRAQ